MGIGKIGENGWSSPYNQICNKDFFAVVAEANVVKWYWEEEKLFAEVVAA